jgi:hypothetical protein
MSRHTSEYQELKTVVLASMPFSSGYDPLLYISNKKPWDSEISVDDECGWDLMAVTVSLSWRDTVLGNGLTGFRKQFVLHAEPINIPGTADLEVFLALWARRSGRRSYGAIIRNVEGRVEFAEIDECRRLGVPSHYDGEFVLSDNDGNLREEIKSYILTSDELRAAIDRARQPLPPPPPPKRSLLARLIRSFRRAVV